MSDGPHRSLPLQRHWRKFLQRVVTPSFSSGEVVETLSNALKNDLQEALVSQVVNVFLKVMKDGQFSLFQENFADQLEALRRTCPGSTAGNILFECAIEADANGYAGHQAVRMTLENALEALYRSAQHSIEEHCKRKEPWSVLNIRTRLRTAWNDVSCSELATEIMSGKAATTNKIRLTKQTGLDVGPQL